MANQITSNQRTNINKLHEKLTDEQKLEYAWELIDSVYGKQESGSDLGMKLLDIKNRINDVNLEE